MEAEPVLVEGMPINTQSTVIGSEKTDGQLSLQSAASLKKDYMPNESEFQHIKSDSKPEEQPRLEKAQSPTKKETQSEKVEQIAEEVENIAVSEQRVELQKDEPLVDAEKTGNVPKAEASKHSAVSASEHSASRSETFDKGMVPSQHHRFIQFEQKRPHRYQFCGPPISEAQIIASHKDIDEELPNISFYVDRNTASYEKLKLSEIHGKLFNDWRWMERSHDYIQWLFPNHYKSNFNWNSFKLGYDEADYFRRSEELGKKIMRSFEQFLMFMGVQVHIDDAVFELVDKNRLYDVLVENTHNHLRLRRILACLSVTGFRLLALWLINIIKYMICAQPELVKSRWGRSLPKTFQEEWLIYSDGDHEESAAENCFIKELDVFYQVNPALRNFQRLQARYTEQIPIERVE